jgi:hypothetical protein
VVPVQSNTTVGWVQDSRERKQLHALKVKVLGGSESSPRGFLTVTRPDLLPAIAMTTLPSCFSLFDKGRILTHTLTHSSFDFPSFTAGLPLSQERLSVWWGWRKVAGVQRYTSEVERRWRRWAEMGQRDQNLVGADTQNGSSPYTAYLPAGNQQGRGCL